MLCYVSEESWPTNWKTLMENFMEGYPLSALHHDTLHKANPTRLCRHFPPGEAYFGYNAGFTPGLPRSHEKHSDLSDAQQDECGTQARPIAEDPAAAPGAAANWRRRAGAGARIRHLKSPTAARFGRSRCSALIRSAPSARLCAFSDPLAVTGDDDVRSHHRGEHLASVIHYGDAQLERYATRRQTHAPGAVRFELVSSRSRPVRLVGNVRGVDVDVIELLEGSIAAKRRKGRADDRHLRAAARRGTNARNDEAISASKRCVAADEALITMAPPVEVRLVSAGHTGRGGREAQSGDEKRRTDCRD